MLIEKNNRNYKNSWLNNIFKKESIDKPNNNLKINDKIDNNSYECIKERVRIKKNLDRKNKNKDVIDYNHYYCISADMIVI